MSSINSYIIIEPFRVAPIWLDELSEAFLSRNASYKKNICPQYSSELDLMNQFNACQSEHDALEILEIMWRGSQFCDLILVAENHEHLAHRVALGFYSIKYK